MILVSDKAWTYDPEVVSVLWPDKVSEPQNGWVDTSRAVVLASPPGTNAIRMGLLMVYETEVIKIIAGISVDRVPD